MIAQSLQKIMSNKCRLVKDFRASKLVGDEELLSM
jgi:hypothetical protein